jgi:hypothetical protein
MPAKGDPASTDPSVPGDPERPARPGPGIDDDPRWTAVSPEQPCPVCGATAGLCGLALEEGLVACASVPSERPRESGGWLHQLARRPQGTVDVHSSTFE